MAGVEGAKAESPLSQTTNYKMIPINPSSQHDKYQERLFQGVFCRNTQGFLYIIVIKKISPTASEEGSTGILPAHLPRQEV